MKKKIIIGVTGNLASGKTAVADMFKELGAVKIDADEIAHELLSKDEGIKKEVLNAFGEEILSDGEIDRRKLAEIVFCNKEKLTRLCSIMHPAIIQVIKEETEKSRGEIIVLDAPLLLEAGLADYVDVVVVVTAGYRTQMDRAIARGIEEEEAKNIINNQMPVDEKIRFADHVIDNDFDLGTTKEGVKELWQKVKVQKVKVREKKN